MSGPRQPNRDTLLCIYLGEFRGEIQDLFTKLSGLQQGQIKPGVRIINHVLSMQRIGDFLHGYIAAGLAYSFLEEAAKKILH